MYRNSRGKKIETRGIPARTRGIKQKVGGIPSKYCGIIIGETHRSKLIQKMFKKTGRNSIRTCRNL
jgi:hypothetical protein